MSSPSPIQTFLVPPGEKGTTLSVFVASHLGISGSKAKRLLDAKAVWVNGKRVWMAKHSLSAGDRVEIRSGPPPQPPKEDLKILLEDEILLAVMKPAGTISESHPRSLEQLLRDRKGLPKLRAVHRLDRDTSGAQLFLKDASYREHMIHLFKTQAVGKTYSVLLAGTFSPRTVEVKKALDGKSAESRFRLIKAHKGFCRAECRILTGRTHQIRRHAGELNCRVLGDSQYTKGPSMSQREKSVPRQMLHAETLQFAHPATGESVSLHAPWPTDFRHTAKQVGLLS